VPIRVLLVDDHPAVLKRLKCLLSSEFVVVATACNGLEMLTADAAHHPDVIVSDITMGGMTGIEANRRVLERRPGVPIVILSACREAEVVQRAFEVGASAYARKLCAGDDLIPAIYAALQGRHFVSASCNYHTAC
jgi:DNA-binding NarL/FixJ family response regulator